MANPVEAPSLPHDLRVHPESLATGPAGARTWALELRCHQWVKNLLVLAAPAAVASLGQSVVAARAALAFVVFCLMSSAVYLLNDVVDMEEDLRHPLKRHRPIASGLIGIPEALIAAAGCGVIALITAALVDAQLLLVVMAYAGLNLLYTSWARRVPVLDIGLVAACFLLRALAGAAATGVGISGWLALAVTLGALLVAAGKRYGEIADRAARRSRSVLRRYSPQTLRRIGAGAGIGTIISYAVWTLAGGPHGIVGLRMLSILPFAVALIRYLKLVGQGLGGTPDRLILEDRHLQLAALAWALLFFAGA
jgi:decaprenyl-phosphate phosphoribosyltransferase